jgi:hypothetical protein
MTSADDEDDGVIMVTLMKIITGDMMIMIMNRLKIVGEQFNSAPYAIAMAKVIYSLPEFI